MTHGAVANGLSSGAVVARSRLLQFAAPVAWIAALISTSLIVAGVALAENNHTMGPGTADNLTFLGCAAIGALVVSRRPRNAVGWILCGVALFASLDQAAWQYGYVAVTHPPPRAPLGLQSLWLAEWIWVPAVGLGMTFMAVRLPDGRLGRGMQIVEWLAVAGTIALIVALALRPGQLDPRLSANNPFGIAGAGGLLTTLKWVGYASIGVAVLVAAASVIGRLRGSRGDEREQLKWIATAAALMTIALAYGFIRQAISSENLFDALLPFLISSVTMPVAIGVALLKYRLYDIDLIINRALVYGSLTAVVAGLFALSLALSQQFVASTGQRSEVAIVVTAFVAAAAFTPIKGALQRAVDARFAVVDPVTNLNSLRSQVEVIAQVLDGRRIAMRLVDELAADYRANFASLSLNSESGLVPVHHSGDPSTKIALAIPLRSRGREVGVLVVGERHGGLSFSERDCEALQRCADVVAEVLEVAGSPGQRAIGNIAGPSSAVDLEQGANDKT